jgi:hypothetical protein
MNLLENQWKKSRVYKGFQGINSFVMEEKRVYEIIRGLQTMERNILTYLKLFLFM